MRVTSIFCAIVALSLIACGSPEQDPPRDPPPERTTDEPLEVAPPPLIEDTAQPLALPPPQTYELLDALTRMLVPVPTGGDCSYLAEDDPGASFGAILSPYVRDADTREVACLPISGGFQCHVAIVKSTGGEDEEYGIFLDLQVDGAHAIDPRSIVCHLAG